MPRLKEIWEKTPPTQRFGNPDLIAAMRSEEARDQRQKLIDACQDCDGHGQRVDECLECGGSGEVEITCEHENAEVPEQELNQA